MSSSDSAFLWETEAIRLSRPEPKPKGPDDWVTLRQAHNETGVSITTLRRWARKEQVPTYLQTTDTGQLRMVSRAAVHRRAADLGRPDVIVSTAEPPPGNAENTANQPDVASAPPPGTMLVPIDAWDKMLMQLGNLHEAGQQLAEARERAVKAETEVEFLKERLAEQRMRPPAPDRFKPEILEPDPGPPPPLPAAEHRKTPGFTRLMWRAWRTRPKS